MIGNRTRPDGVLAPKTEVERVGIGTRVRVVFTDVARGLAVPNGPLMRGTPAARRGDTGVRGAQPGSRTSKRYHYSQGHRAELRQIMGVPNMTDAEAGRTRDFLGYGRQPPDPRWPNAAHVAVNFVINYEEGGEYSVPDSDPVSEAALTEGATAAVAGRDLAAESMFMYGAEPDSGACIGCSPSETSLARCLPSPVLSSGIPNQRQPFAKRDGMSPAMGCGGRCMQISPPRRNASTFVLPRRLLPGAWGAALKVGTRVMPHRFPLERFCSTQGTPTTVTPTTTNFHTG